MSLGIKRFCPHEDMRDCDHCFAGLSIESEQIMNLEIKPNYQLTRAYVLILEAAALLADRAPYSANYLKSFAEYLKLKFLKEVVE